MNACLSCLSWGYRNFLAYPTKPFCSSQTFIDLQLLDSRGREPRAGRSIGSPPKALASPAPEKTEAMDDDLRGMGALAAGHGA